MKNILVIRNDKIGDFMLCWPAIALIKKSIECCRIVALVPKYTEELALHCTYIDKTIIDTGKDNQNALIKEIQSYNFDYSICFFSNYKNASLVWKSGIKQRFAPATKICQFLYNHRLKQKRSQSLKPEYKYNMDLSSFFLEKTGQKKSGISFPLFSFPKKELDQHRHKFSFLTKSNEFICFIHPCTGGSSTTLDLNQWLQLAEGISAIKKCVFVVSAGPGEKEISEKLHERLRSKSLKSLVYVSDDGIMDFCKSIACANLFIAGSTGPLHIAGALDIPTIGFYPQKRSSSSLRWRTINSPNKHIGFSFKEGNHGNHIDLNQALKKITHWHIWQQSMNEY